MANRPKADTVTGGKAEADFARVTRAFADDLKVTFGRLFASDGLKVDDKIFAMLVRGNLVAKLPRARVDALVAARQGERFDPGHGRLMKEWVVVAPGAGDWLALAREARAFVGGG
jgi:predicted HAD superfamily Cof-like phosphohydrolase